MSAFPYYKQDTYHIGFAETAQEARCLGGGNESEPVNVDRHWRGPLAEADFSRDDLSFQELASAIHLT